MANEIPLRLILNFESKILKSPLLHLFLLKCCFIGLLVLEASHAECCKGWECLSVGIRPRLILRSLDHHSTTELNCTCIVRDIP